MKLSDLPDVWITDQVHQKLDARIAAVEQTKFCMTIAGDRVDDALLAVARPAIIAELRARKAVLERKLISYGVEID